MIGHCFGILKSFVIVMKSLDDLILRKSYDLVIDDFMALKNFMVLLFVYKFKVLMTLLNWRVLLLEVYDLVLNYELDVFMDCFDL